ncbi:hypothetical protein VTO42DRAFT_2674 [Malbranchea cinnamomea]
MLFLRARGVALAGSECVYDPKPVGQNNRSRDVRVSSDDDSHRFNDIGSTMAVAQVESLRMSNLYYDGSFNMPTLQEMNMFLWESDGLQNPLLSAASTAWLDQSGGVECDQFLPQLGDSLRDLRGGGYSQQPASSFDKPAYSKYRSPTLASGSSKSNSSIDGAITPRDNNDVRYNLVTSDLEQSQ